MILPGRYDLVLPQRATFRLPLRLKAAGVAFDATGCTVVAEMWADLERTTKLGDLSVVWTDQAAGELELFMAPADTALVTASGYWDLLVVQPNGDQYYWLEGRVTIDEGLSAVAA